ncbi:MAG: class I SAM-dependent RNA methyltransferase [Candidatus Nanopelagicales bacterium]
MSQQPAQPSGNAAGVMAAPPAVPEPAMMVEASTVPEPATVVEPVETTHLATRTPPAGAASQGSDRGPVVDRQRYNSADQSLPVGTEVEVAIERVAHGGHCVARHGGRVLFVRHALPGELVRARVTALGPQGRFLQADAVEILRPAAGRREPPCPAFRPGGCGGCDWQHASPELSRELKHAVVVEAFARFGPPRTPDPEQLRPLPVEPSDLGWRTRTNLAVTSEGRAGLRVHHSRDVVALDACPQLVDPGAGGAFTRRWPAGGNLRWVRPSGVGPDILAREASSQITESVAGRVFAVAADGFWQAHRAAAALLVETVTEFVAPAGDERVIDLYAGVGLFGLTLAASRPGLRVTLVEGDRRAAGHARTNAAGIASVVWAPVEKWVRRPVVLTETDAVVLDPPRKGAGRAVLAALSAAAPARICYVACDPVALARDAATLCGLGYELTAIRVFDLFPNTKHIESVALFCPARSRSRSTLYAAPVSLRIT